MPGARRLDYFPLHLVPEFRCTEPKWGKIMKVRSSVKKICAKCKIVRQAWYGAGDLRKHQAQATAGMSQIASRLVRFAAGTHG